jgi:hypothetical protein
VDSLSGCWHNFQLNRRENLKSSRVKHDIKDGHNLLFSKHYFTFSVAFSSGFVHSLDNNVSVAGCAPVFRWKNVPYWVR